MQALEMVRAASSRTGRHWRMASRRHRLVIVLAGMVAIFTGWFIYDWLFVWQPRLRLKGNGGNYPIAFSPDGTSLVTSRDRGFSLWDTRNGKKLADWSKPDDLKGTSGRFSPDGKTFVAFWSIQDANGTPMIGLIDVATGQIRISFPRPLPYIVGTAFRNEGQTLRVFSRDNKSRSVVDVNLATGLAGPPLPFSCPVGISWQVMSDDGRTLAVVDTRAMTIPTGMRSVILWDLDRDRQIGVISTSVTVGSINAMCLSRDGKMLVMSLSDKTIEAWDVPSNKLLSKFAIHSADFRPWMLRLSDDGSKVASIGLWVKPALSINTARFLMQRLARNPNPMIFELVVHDVATGRRLGRSDNEGMATVFSSDGRIMATSHDDEATRIHDLPASR